MKNKSLKFKLYTLSVLLIFISVIVGGISYQAQSKIVNEYSYVVDSNLPNIRSVGLMIARYRLARVLATELAVEGVTKEEGVKIIAEYKKAWEDFELEHQSYLKIEFAPGEDVVYQEFKKSYEDVKKTLDEIVSIYEKGVATGVENHKGMATIILTDAKEKEATIRVTANKILDFHVNLADKRAETAAQVTKMGAYTILGTIALGAILGGLFAVTFSTGLVNTLTKISDSLNAAGIQVSSGSNQIASTAQELSQSTTEQSASLEETAASIEEMSSMIQKSTENAKKTYDFANSSKESAVTGKEVVVEMIESIEEINQSNQNIMSAIDESNKKMEEIVAVIGEIGNKTKVINDIVFQTKLLSFNASVEAARAGEMGKGFAVVAEEVGNLAEVSGNAAKEISEMLSSSMTKVDDIVKMTKTKVERLVDEGKKKVEAGTVVAQKCGEVLDTIVSNVDDVNKLASEIAVASDEQSKGIQEISKATAMLETVTQQNSTASEESARASEDLSRQAQELNHLVTELVHTINGGAGDYQAARNSNVVSINKKTKTLVAKAAPKKAKSTISKKVSGDSYAPSPDDERFMDA